MALVVSGTVITKLMALTAQSAEIMLLMVNEIVNGTAVNGLLQY